MNHIMITDVKNHVNFGKEKKVWEHGTLFGRVINIQPHKHNVRAKLV